MTSTTAHVPGPPGGTDQVSRAELLDRVRGLVPMLHDRAAQTEADGRVDSEVMEALTDAGVFRLLQPKRFGGLEYGLSDVVRVSLALSAGCGSTGWNVAVSGFHNWLVALYPIEAQQEIWEDRRALVAGGYMPVGRIEASPGGYRVSGSWEYASNCDNSSWFVVGGMMPGSQPPTPSWFLLPASGARIEDTWHVAGMAGTGSKSIVIDEPVFVPEHRVLPVPVINSGCAPGTEIHDNPIYKMTFEGAGPFWLSSVLVGIGLGALADFTEIARSKTTIRFRVGGLGPVSMAELESVQLAITEASAALDGASQLLLRDTTSLDELFERGELPSVDDRIRNRRDHAYVARQASHAVNTLFEAQGASAGDLASPIQRAWRDVNVGARHIAMNWQANAGMYAQHQLGREVVGWY